jgi:hypothetical protein
VQSFGRDAVTRNLCPAYLATVGAPFVREITG